MYRVRQHFDTIAIVDPEKEIRELFNSGDLGRRVRPGQTVAVAVGSRGIDNLTGIVSAAVTCLRDLGLAPYIIPAMGSHGGAQADGQVEVLRDLGIKENTVGAKVVSRMNVVSFGRLGNGAEVFCAKDALSADHLFVINRVKPHTAFHAEVESGLCKMLAVGCGKHEGAKSMHTFGLGDSIVPAAKRIISKGNVLGGLALLENSLDQTCLIRLATPENMVAVDSELLLSARKLLPRIPIASLDILIIDQMGKNISGAGIDPNVVGFWRRDGGPREPDYRTLIALELTPQSHGNAVGLGLVDMTSQRLIEAVDYDATYTNVLTSGIWAAVKTPVVLETDRIVLETALSKIANPARVRMARIRNTLQLETFWVSESLLPELLQRSDVEVEDLPFSLEFDVAGRLLPAAR